MKHVLGYLLQHLTSSAWHRLQLQDAYDALVQNWHLLEWEMYEDTFEDRKLYRSKLDDIEKSRGKKRKKCVIFKTTSKKVD